MKIGSPIETAALPAVAPAGGGSAGRAESGTAKAAPSRPAAAPGGESAPVRLSAAAASLKTMASTPEFDAGKVQAIRQAIDDGTFQVDAGVIADRLLGNARELLGRVSH